MGILKNALFIIILHQNGLLHVRGSSRVGPCSGGVSVPALLSLGEDAEGVQLLVHLGNVFKEELFDLH